MRLPLVGEWLMDKTCQPAKFPPEVQACMQYQGYRRALLSNMRYGPFGDISDVYRRLGKQPRPTLLLWGTADEAIAFPVSDQVRQALPYAEFHAIDGGSHKPYLEQPEKVNPLLVEFLKR